MFSSRVELAVDVDLAVLAVVGVNDVSPLAERDTALATKFRSFAFPSSYFFTVGSSLGHSW